MIVQQLGVDERTMSGKWRKYEEEEGGGEGFDGCRLMGSDMARLVVQQGQHKTAQNM
jgi:hypothetical protein